jgi:hypothetical protein
MFKLTAKKRVLSEAARPQDLDFSKLHGARCWEVSLNGRAVARVCFAPASQYRIMLSGVDVDRLNCHSRIVPTVQRVLEVWSWEKRFESESLPIIDITPYWNG